MFNLCAIRRRLNDFLCSIWLVNAEKHLLIGRLFKLNLPFFVPCPVIWENGVTVTGRKINFCRGLISKLCNQNFGTGIAEKSCNLFTDLYWEGSMRDNGAPSGYLSLEYRLLYANFFKVGLGNSWIFDWIFKSFSPEQCHWVIEWKILISPWLCLFLGVGLWIFE